VSQFSYTDAFEVNFDAFREPSVVQNHSYFNNFEHPFDAFGPLMYQFSRLYVSETKLFFLLISSPRASLDVIRHKMEILECRSKINGCILSCNIIFKFIMSQLID
jgi:hypothetical protein